MSEHSDVAEIDAATGRLRDVGLRVTSPRLAVLRVLADQPHADAAAVGDAVRQLIGSASTQAIYDVLAALTAAGLIRRIEPAGSPARYEVRVGDNHHHLVCRRCGAVTDVDCASGRRPCMDAPAATPFPVDEVEVTYWGLCGPCSMNDQPKPPIRA